MQLTEDQQKRYLERKVIVVSDDDQALGTTDLISAHRNGGIRHRAFSLILYRPTLHKASRGKEKFEVLLQRRALVKPIFSGLWANTCCYNLAPGEDILMRARSRVWEELGITLGDGPLGMLYKFSYEAEDNNGWWENEVDHVVVGEWDGEVVPNPDEVMGYKWVEWGEMKEWMKREPEIFAPWWELIVVDGRVDEYMFGGGK